MKLPASFYIKSFLPLLVLFLGAGLFFVYALLPELGRLEGLEGEVEEINREIDLAGGFIRSRPEMTEEIEKLARRHRTLKAKIPSGVDTALIIGRISDEIDRHGIELVALSPHSVEIEEGAGRVMLKLQLKSDFIGLGRFMKAIEEMDMLFAVSEFDMRGLPESAELDVSMVLKSYFREE